MLREQEMILVTPQDLTEAGFSVNTVKSAVRRGQIKLHERGKYLWSSLPESYKEQMVTTLWAGMQPDVWLAMREAESTLAGALAAVRDAWGQTLRMNETADGRYLRELKPRAGNKGIPTGWIYELTRSAGVLTMLASFETGGQIRKAFGGTITNKGALREAVLQVIWHECGWVYKQVEGKNTISETAGKKDVLKGCRFTNVQTLQRAESEFAAALSTEIVGVAATHQMAERRKAALQTLLRRLKLGNENRKVVGKSAAQVYGGGAFDFHQLAIVQALANVGGSLRLGYRGAYEGPYVELCLQRNVQPIPFGTFYRHASSDHLQAKIAKERFGAKAANDAWTPFVSAERSRYAGSVIAMDDWVAEVPFQALASNGQTVVRKRLTVVFICDHATGCPVGWAIAPSATGKVAREAMRKMMRLNGGRAALELILR